MAPDPDGSYIAFASNRPIDGNHEPIGGDWDGKFHPGRGGNLWRVNRQGSGWGDPARLPVNVNRFDSTFSPSIASDGRFQRGVDLGRCHRLERLIRSLMYEKS
jgi:hypothetical protein